MDPHWKVTTKVSDELHFPFLAAPQPPGLQPASTRGPAPFPPTTRMTGLQIPETGVQAAYPHTSVTNFSNSLASTKHRNSYFTELGAPANIKHIKTRDPQGSTLLLRQQKAGT